MQDAERKAEGTPVIPRLPWRVLSCTAPALALSIVATIWCWWATAAGLGLFLGAILLLTLYGPPLALAEAAGAQWIVAAAASAGVGFVWLFSIASADVSAKEWLLICVVLASYSFAMAGIAALLRAARLPAAVASGVTILLGLLWLTWPVWTSTWLTQDLADWLVPAHPLLAINGVVRHLGTWDRGSLAYRSLTVLNQDVPYHLPLSIWPAVLLHLVLGIPGIVFHPRITSRSAESL